TLIILTSSQSNSAQPPSSPLAPLSLTDVFKIALAKNETMAIQESRGKQLQERLKQAEGTIYPKLALLGTYDKQDKPENTTIKSDKTIFKLQATAPIYHGGREIYMMRAANLDLLSQEEQKEIAKINLYSQVGALYYSLLMVDADVQNLFEQLELTSLRIKELKERTTLGRSRKSELLNAESQKALLLAQIDSQQVEKSNYQENFTFVTGIETETAIIDQASAHENLFPQLAPITVYLQLLDDRPDLHALKAQIDSQEQSVSAARSGHFPSLDLTGGYYLENSGQPRKLVPAWDVKISLSFSLFEGGIISSQVNESLEKWREKRLTLDQARRNAEREIRSAYVKIQKNQTQLKSYRQALLAAERA
ncbi:MAG: TolC family protein, partial [Oligoflexia bacterium]|nr:TolC family protein [Oligoflexia bacterium]